MFKTLSLIYIKVLTVFPDLEPDQNEKAEEFQ